MKILYISQWFCSLGGGGEVVFQDLAKGMSQHGHNVHVICAQIKTLNHDLENGNEHRIKPLLDLPPPTLLQNILYFINALLKGCSLLRGRDFQLIHANNLVSAIVGIILSKLFRLPLVVTIHDVFTTSSQDHWQEWTKQEKKISKITSVIAPIMERFTVKISSGIIHTVSNTTKEDLIKFGAKTRIEVIPNGINLDDYNLHSDINYDRYIVFIGRLVFYKNLDVIISAFIDVVKQIQSPKMLILGDGPMRKKWEKRVSELGLQENIIFFGYVSDIEKIKLLSRSSALVLPSFVEGFGLVVLEAFAMRKPVLVADVKPLSELVSDNIDGFVLPVDSPKKWSEKLIYILSNKEVCEKMGKAGRQKAEKEYNLERVINNMESLYKSLLRE